LKLEREIEAAKVKVDQAIFRTPVIVSGERGIRSCNITFRKKVGHSLP